MSSVTPFLWYDDDGEAAMNFYVSVFPNSTVIDRSSWNEGGPVPAGGMMVGEFELDGQRVMILNGGPHFRLSEAFSFSVSCKDQEEIDYYWNALTADGGQESQCGWLKDKFGLSWQIVPTRLAELLAGDPDGAQRVVAAFMQMRKFDIAALERAYAGE